MTDDPLVWALWVSLALTTVSLVQVLRFGRAGRVPAHLRAVGLFLVLFVIAVGFAETVGRRYRFDRTLELIHLPIAITGALAVFGPLVTGWRRWRGRGSLRAHRIAIVIFLVLFVAATATGVLMIRTGVPR
jgi:type IV secretory pathway VirB2 component (pilin)